ncbi:flavin reductase family protein [Streptomyces sp. NPDC102360]|uniref:flavin reductase family protein n=1 Tax=Streptomyces sp. NPDC102360 TaxID=3366160 RepID=UPI00381DF091
MHTKQLPSFRDVLGHFASGVTVVTGTDEHGPVGFTCQSFSSLSLDPPQIIVLPGRSSTSWPRIAAGGRFCVNILADHQGDISTTFATPGIDKFADVAWTRSPSGLPRLDETCAWLDCTVAEVHPGGDHRIVIGAVDDLGATLHTRPLLFHRGHYAGMTGLRHRPAR